MSRHRTAGALAAIALVAMLVVPATAFAEKVPPVDARGESGEQASREQAPEPPPKASATETRAPWRVRLGAEAEYYAPVHDDRQIHTGFAGAYVGVEPVLLRPLGLSLWTGVVGTFATGHIVQLLGSFEEGTFRSERFDTTVAGLGQLFVLRVMPRIGPIGIGMDGTLGAFLYSAGFPPGGDHYNLTWRIGPVIDYDVTERLRVGVAVRYTHLSNGQGIGPHNPSYEAAGVSLMVSHAK